MQGRHSKLKGQNLAGGLSGSFPCYYPVDRGPVNPQGMTTLSSSVCVAPTVNH